MYGKWKVRWVGTAYPTNFFIEERAWKLRINYALNTDTVQYPILNYTINNLFNYFTKTCLFQESQCSTKPLTKKLVGYVDGKAMAHWLHTYSGFGVFSCGRCERNTKYEKLTSKLHYQSYKGTP